MLRPIVASFFFPAFAIGSAGAQQAATVDSDK